MGKRSWLQETPAERAAQEAAARRDAAVQQFADFHKGLTPREKEMLAAFVEAHQDREELMLYAIYCACRKA